MKKPILFLFCAGLVASSFAQTVKWDSTYRPAAYELKVEQFRSYPKTPGDIIFLGNSITERNDWSELLSIPNAKNRGISADISFGVLQRLDEVTSRQPAKVFVLIGINDISRNIPDSIILRNYRLIIDRIHKESPKTKIYFHTLLPVNNEFGKRGHFNKDEHIACVNAGLKAMAKEKNITVIDLHDHYLNAEGKLDKKYTVDGLHLNAAGYQVWKKILEEGHYLDK